MDAAALERVYEAFRDFHDAFGRKQPRKLSRDYLQGLLVQSEERRNAENLSEAVASSPVTPTDALQVARREVSRHRAQEISREWTNNPVDAATKFYVLAKDATENDTLIFAEANLLAHAIGVSLAKNDAAMKRVVSFNGDNLSLLSARDRLASRSIGEDIQPVPRWTPSTPPP